MSLLDRIRGTEKKIAVHTFYSCLKEWDAGEFIKQDVVDVFELSSEDIVELDWLTGQLALSSNKERFIERIHNIFILMENNITKYQTNAEVQAVIERIG